MQPEVLPWIAPVISILTLLYVFLGDRSKAHERRLTVIEKKSQEEADALALRTAEVADRADALENRMTKVEEAMSHLPDKDVVHRLELSLTRMEGEMGNLAERMKPIGAIGERLQDFLIAGLERSTGGEYAMSFDTIFRQDARLSILRALAAEPNDALNDSLLQQVLEAHGISRSRDWLREELRVMAELGAIRVNEAGSVKIAQLTQKGRDHVERRQVIEGIKRPRPPE